MNHKMDVTLDKNSVLIIGLHCNENNNNTERKVRGRTSGPSVQTDAYVIEQHQKALESRSVSTSALY